VFQAKLILLDQENVSDYMQSFIQEAIFENSVKLYGPTNLESFHSFFCKKPVVGTLGVTKRYP